MHHYKKEADKIHDIPCRPCLLLILLSYVIHVKTFFIRSYPDYQNSSSVNQAHRTHHDMTVVR